MKEINNEREREHCLLKKYTYHLNLCYSAVVGIKLTKSLPPSGRASRALIQGKSRKTLQRNKITASPNEGPNIPFLIV